MGIWFTYMYHKLNHSCRQIYQATMVFYGLGLFEIVESRFFCNKRGWEIQVGTPAVNKNFRCEGNLKLSIFSNLKGCHCWSWRYLFFHRLMTWASFFPLRVLQQELGCGFQHFLFSPLFREDFQFDYVTTFFRWVEATNQRIISIQNLCFCWRVRIQQEVKCI